MNGSWKDAQFHQGDQRDTIVLEPLNQCTWNIFYVAWTMVSLIFLILIFSNSALNFKNSNHSRSKLCLLQNFS